MKNIKYLLCILGGFILAIGISSAYILNASLVTYDNKNTTLESDTVSGALNELGVLATTKLTKIEEKINDLNNELGDKSLVATNVSISEYLKYCIDNGYLPDLNEVSLIPSMTGNTISGGEASASSYQSHSSNYAPFNAFDGMNNTWWISTGSTNETGQWLQYKFNNPKVVTKLEINIYVDANSTNCNFELSGSNDGINFVSLKTFTAKVGETVTEKIVNNDSYSYYRLTTKSTSGSYSSGNFYYSVVKRLQLYGH